MSPETVKYQLKGRQREISEFILVNGLWQLSFFSLNPSAAANQSKQLLSSLKICLIFIFKYASWIVSFHRFNVILSPCI